MTGENLLSQLAENLGIDSIPLDENGCTQLIFGESLTVQIEFHQDTQEIHLHTSLAPIPTEGREALFEELLSANLLGSQTAGNTLAIDLAVGDILLCKSFSQEETSFAHFQTKLEGFLQAAEFWQEKLTHTSHRPIHSSHEMAELMRV